MNQLKRLSKEQLHQRLDVLSSTPGLDGDMRRLLHELEVYQLELELQNRELREAQIALETSRDRYADLYYTAPVGYLTLDRRGIIREINGAAANILGVDRPKLLGHTLYRWLLPQDHASFLAHLRGVFEEHSQQSLEVALRCAPGSSFVGYVRLQSLSVQQPGAGGERLCHSAMIDLTERRRAEETIRALNANLEQRVEERTAELRLAASVFHNTIQGVLISDQHNRILSVNPAFTEITGYRAEEVLGRSPALLQCDRHSPGFYQEIGETLGREGRWRGEVWHRRKDGEDFLVWLTVSLVSDANDQPAGYVALFNDVTEVRRKDEHIRHMAFHDPLTDLPNRALLLDRLGHAISMAKREKTHLGLLFIDLDHFKEVNDTLGHNVGDGLLQEVARRLRATVRASDTVARMGGDEFVVLMESMAVPQDCTVLATKILTALGAELRVDEHALRVTGSLGIALYPEHGEDAVTLMRHADIALYAAKAAGRGVHRFFQASMLDKPKAPPHLETDLRQALVRGELELYYQPKVCLSTGLVCGLEALLRWRHPELGLVLPGEFLPTAEETGLIAPIGAWVLQEASRQAAVWRAHGLARIRIAVNISAGQLLAGDLVRQIRAMMERYGLGPESLELEMNERSVMLHPHQYATLFQELRTLGVGLAIDDFGSDSTSLAYLQHLPLDAIKVGRALVRHADQGPHENQVMRMSVALGNALNLTVGAQGVETQAQAEALRRCCCRLAQGYLYSPPLPVPELERLWLLSQGLMAASATPPVSCQTCPVA